MGMIWDMGQWIKLGYLGNWWKLLTRIIHLLDRARVASIQNIYAVTVLTNMVSGEERMSANVRKVLSFQT